jgi:corrinoid protein of di/trimethylamine methyltransferase
VNDEIFKAMTQSIIDGDAEEARDLANKAIEQGIEPMEAINNGYIPGVDYIGEQFSSGEAFLPELVMAGDAMKAAVEILEAEMARKGTTRDVAGKVIVATVQGDIHDIGKTLVGIMLSIGGFEVLDMGTNVSFDRLLEKIREFQPDIIGLSALLTTTMVKQRDFIEALDDMGLRDTVKVMVGGAPVTRNWANEIGADGFSEDAVGAVALAKQLLKA